MARFLTHTTAALSALILTLSSLAAITTIPADSHGPAISATVLA